MSRIVGRRGPEVVISGRIASLLERHAGLDRFRLEKRGTDPELDATLDDVHQVALAWRQSRGIESEPAAEVAGTIRAEQAEQTIPCEWMLSGAVAARLRVTTRWVRMLIKRGELEAERHGNTWRIRTESVADYLERAA